MLRLPAPRRRRPIAGLALVVALALSVILVAIVAVAPVWAKRVNAVALVDYRQKNFKVGDWVRYRVETTDSHGHEDVNYQKVSIVGEEVFRGERCFWVETIFGADLANARHDLTLVSEDAFRDPDADVRFGYYLRMMLFGLDEEGKPDMMPIDIAKASLEKRTDPKVLRGQVDTVGVETVETPKGSLSTQVVALERKLQNSRATEDSTINRITRTVRKNWLSRKIPITSLAREEQTVELQMQAYKLGTVSTDAPVIILSSQQSRAIVEDWGTGAKSVILEEWRAKKKATQTGQAGVR